MKSRTKSSTSRTTIPDDTDFERMDQRTTAALLSVDERTLRRWHVEREGIWEPPRNRDGTYHLQALLWWQRALRLRNGARRS
jgi:hypothetical protein